MAVLMATHNGILWVDDQIKSILDQVGVAVTLFISDDISRDGTREHIKKLARKNTRVILLPKAKPFKNAARNFYHLIRSVDFKAFDYVSLSDQDDIWATDKLSRAVHQMQIQNATCYSSDVLAFWENGKTMLIKKSQPQVAFDYLFESAGPGCTFVMTQDRALFLKKYLIRFEDEIDKVFHHDWLIYALMRSSKFKWVIDDYIGLRYRQHQKNETGAHQGFKASVKRVKKIFDGWWLGQVRMVANFCGQPQKQFIHRYLKLEHEQFFSLAFKTHLLRRRSRDVFVLRFIFLGLGLKKFFDVYEK